MVISDIEHGVQKAILFTTLSLSRHNMLVLLLNISLIIKLEELKTGDVVNLNKFALTSDVDLCTAKRLLERYS